MVADLLVTEDVSGGAPLESCHINMHSNYAEYVTVIAERWTKIFEGVCFVENPVCQRFTGG